MKHHLWGVAGRGVAIGISVLFLGWLIAQASFHTPKPPTEDPPQQAIGAPLTPLEWQSKLGGIGINLNLGTPAGLVVEGNAPGVGIVRIGPPAAYGGEKLNLHGNLAISGVIRPSGDVPESMDILTRATSTIVWKGPGWISIMGDFSSDYSCTGSSPILCQAFGLEEYQRFCLGNNGYSAWVRVCREP
mgnify:CR=1 FL=1